MSVFLTVHHVLFRQSVPLLVNIYGYRWVSCVTVGAGPPTVADVRSQLCTPLRFVPSRAPTYRRVIDHNEEEHNCQGTVPIPLFNPGVRAGSL